jgi:hypothetical protein
VIVDSVDHFTNKTIYWNELELVLEGLNPTKLTFIYSQGNPTYLDAGLYPVVCNFISKENFQLSNFEMIASVLQSNTILIDLSNSEVAWLSSFTNIASIRYVCNQKLDANNSKEILNNHCNTLLGKIRAVTSDSRISKETKIDRHEAMRLKNDQLIWRKTFEEMIFTPKLNS